MKWIMKSSILKMKRVMMRNIPLGQVPSLLEKAHLWVTRTLHQDVIVQRKQKEN